MGNRPAGSRAKLQQQRGHKARKLMVVETGPTAVHHMQELLLMSKQDEQVLREKNPELVVREVEEDDLKRWSLSPAIFHDDVPWRGVRPAAWEFTQERQGFLATVVNENEIKKRWGLAL